MEISWIDSSENDRKKVIEILETINESEAVDELGIGIIRDYFSDYFFPGTATPQTRAKYFVLSSYILKDLYNKNIENPNDYLEILSKNEKECASLLLKNADEQSKKGIIGSRNLQGRRKTWVKRGTTEIYWNGIREYKIVDTNLSLKEYARTVAETKREIRRSLANKKIHQNINEDGIDSSISSGYRLSSPKVPKTYNKDWMKDLNIELTKEEAEFLKDLIVANTNGRLLGAILATKEIREEFAKLEENNKIFDSLEEIVQKLKSNKKINDEVYDKYFLAKKVSEFLYCPLIIYNVMLSPNDEKIKEKWELYEKKDLRKIAQEVDLRKLESIPKLNISRDLKYFLQNLKDAMMQYNVDRIKKLVIEREKAKKRGREKLNKGIETNGRWTGLEKLTYRTFTAQRLVKDIVEGLNKC